MPDRHDDPDIVHGWLVFSADVPLCGLDPHPAYAPEALTDAPVSATGWAEAIGVLPTREAAETEILDDLETVAQAVGRGDVSDDGAEQDFALPVSVDAHGILSVFSDGVEIARYTPEILWQDGYGMTPPRRSAHGRLAQTRAMSRDRGGDSP